MPLPDAPGAAIAAVETGETTPPQLQAVFHWFDELDELARIPFFSHNRTNLISFFDQDHGARDGGDLAPAAWSTAVTGFDMTFEEGDDSRGPRVSWQLTVVDELLSEAVAAG